MGMFDDIEFDYRMPDGFESRSGYQSKDLECTGDQYEVTPNGRLVRTFDSGWPRADEKRPLGDMHYNGKLNIYDGGLGGAWHEYDLEFRDGDLIAIHCHQTRGRLLFEPAGNRLIAAVQVTPEQSESELTPDSHAN